MNSNKKYFLIRLRQLWNYIMNLINYMKKAEFSHRFSWEKIDRTLKRSKMFFVNNFFRKYKIYQIFWRISKIIHTYILLNHN